MVVVSAASDSTKLTTLAQAKLALGLKPSDVADEPMIRSEIDRSSAATAAWLGRPLAKQQYIQTWRNVSACALCLSNLPVASIVSVTADSSELDASGYEYDAESGMLWRLSGDARIDWSASKVVVEYVAGWVLPEQTVIGSDPAGTRDLPFDIEAAAIELVKMRYFGSDRDPLLKSASIPGAMTVDYALIGAGMSGSLPGHIAALLEPYRVPAFA